MPRPAWVSAILALLIALIFSTLPLPSGLAIVRPALVPMVMVYLCLSAPSRFGIVWAWCLGLVLDVSHATTLGQHALALSLLSYAALKLRPTILLFPAWQQGLFLAPLWLGYQALLLWLDGFVDQSIDPMWRWLPALSSSLLWPLVCAGFALLDRPQHHRA
jgi:rod shape-determining protein MreD